MEYNYKRSTWSNFPVGQFAFLGRFLPTNRWNYGVIVGFVGVVVGLMEVIVRIVGAIVGFMGNIVRIMDNC